MSIDSLYFLSDIIDSRTKFVLSSRHAVLDHATTLAFSFNALTSIRCGTYSSIRICFTVMGIFS